MRYPKKLSEKQIEDRCVALARAVGIRCEKIDRIRRAWPDRMFFAPDMPPYYVEFKRPGEYPRPDQREIHRRLFAAGYPVVVVWSVSQFRVLLNLLSVLREDRRGR